MSLEQTVFAALAPLVASRVYANVMPQSPAVPITPAIVFSFPSVAPTQDICGAGTDAEADTRVQVDVYSTTFDSVRALRLQIQAAMALIAPPMVWQGDNGVEPYDPAMKLHRSSADFIYYPSST